MFSSLKNCNTFIIIVLLSLIVSSCTTYIIPIESYKRQFENIDSTNLKIVRVQGPGFFITEYLTAPLTKIECQTKDGKPSVLKYKPSIEMRVTYLNSEGIKRRRVFYFDRTQLIHGNIYGIESRFISSIDKVIPIDKVILIEVQDGHKNYHYVN